MELAIKATYQKKLKKKNVLVIDQSAKDISFNYSINFEIMTATSDHTISSSKNPCDISLKPDNLSASN